MFGLNLNGLKNPKPEFNLFNKRVENFNPNRLTFKRVDLNPTRLSKQVKRVGFRLPIYLLTQLISNPQKFTSPHEKEKNNNHRHKGNNNQQQPTISAPLSPSFSTAPKINLKDHNNKPIYVHA